MSTKLSTTFRTALLSVSLAALCAAVPLSPRLSVQGLVMAGAAWADEVPGVEEPDPGVDDEDVSDCCDPSPGELAEADFDYEGAISDLGDSPDADTPARSREARRGRQPRRRRDGRGNELRSRRGRGRDRLTGLVGVPSQGCASQCRLRGKI